MAFEGSRGVGRDTVIAAVLLLAALVLLALPEEHHTTARDWIRATVLQPFLLSQGKIAELRAERGSLDQVRAQRDSLMAVAIAQRPLVEENRRLRALLGMQERAGGVLLAAELVRLAEPGAQSTFFVNVGAVSGVRNGSAVIAADGVVGVIRQVAPQVAQGIDWSHPEFRVSAMTDDGETYGIVEPRRGGSREVDMLALVGAPFHSDIPAGTRLVTSGRGGVYPRGIVIGTVVGIEEADTGWRKSYLVRPAVRPSAAMQVLVIPGGAEAAAAADLRRLWQVSAPPDPAAADTVGGGDL